MHAPRIVPMREPAHDLDTPYLCLVIPKGLSVQAGTARATIGVRPTIRRSEVDQVSQDTKDSD
jgi:hypothetical protein